jgi:hypothetical protein
MMLFTGARSKSNIRRYERSGYEHVPAEQPGTVRMSKIMTQA